jgi:FtsH-binding integral membrane protein
MAHHAKRFIEIQPTPLEALNQMNEEYGMSTNSKNLSINMKAAIALLYVFTAAIIAAFITTIISVPANVQILAVGFITPLVVLSSVFIFYCRKGKAWSFAGATILGAIGVLLRVIISTQPNLEVGGGLPVGVTALYIVLGALISLKSYESWLELKAEI